MKWEIRTGARTAGRSSLDGLHAGRLEAGELELHAALELVEQLLQQPGGETQKNQMGRSQTASRESEREKGHAGVVGSSAAMRSSILQNSSGDRGFTTSSV